MQRSLVDVRETTILPLSQLYVTGKPVPNKGNLSHFTIPNRNLYVDNLLTSGLTRVGPNQKMLDRRKPACPTE